MNDWTVKNILIVSLTLSLVAPLALQAGSSDSSPFSASVADSPADNRYGPFNTLAKGSSYGQGSYPEPFLVDDSDLEVNEARVDWLHSVTGSDHSDTTTVEIEKGFGQMTLEIEIPVERDVTDGKSTTNFANIDLGARYPLYQYVAANQAWDTTFGVAAEIGVPTGSAIAKNTEVVPKVFNDSRFGDHFTVQAILGYSTFVGASGDEGGQQTFEYSFVFGYTIPREQLPIPGVLQLIPVFELSGEKGTNKDTSNSLIGDAGLRANLKPIGSIQPRPGIVCVFPLDRAARQDLHWGLFTSLVFEF